MKKAFSLVLIVVIISNTFGNVCIYWGLKKMHKHKMLAKIESGKYDHRKEEIIVRNKDFISGKVIRVNEREIKYLGSMYDIVLEFYDGNKYHFICINDEKENRLDKAFNEMEGKKSKDSLKHLLKIFMPFAVLIQDEFNKFKLVPDNYLIKLVLHHSIISSDVISPPPDRIRS